MPIYEFYCDACNTIFNFFSKTINTQKIPNCPKCKNKGLTRQMSAFAITGKAKEQEDANDLPFDESTMEKAMRMMESEAGKLDQDDPAQAAGLMRKLTDMAGLKLNPGMEEAISRMEKGEDPEALEAQMGDMLETENPFLMPGKKGKDFSQARKAPQRDETLYDL